MSARVALADGSIKESGWRLGKPWTSIREPGGLSQEKSIFRGQKYFFSQARGPWRIPPLQSATANALGLEGHCRSLFGVERERSFGGV